MGKPASGWWNDRPSRKERLRSRKRAEDEEDLQLVKDTLADPDFKDFVLQVLTLLLFGAFAIVAVVMAFIHFWPAGLLLALFLGWRGFGEMSHPRVFASLEEAIERVMPKAESRAASRGATSGNEGFDDYRSETLSRLEDEQRNFEGFLDRLREAKDAQEFDRYMDDRAKRDAPSDDDQSDDDQSDPALRRPGAEGDWPPPRDH